MCDHAVTVAVGFFGVLVILRPGLQEVSLAALIMLMGSGFYGGSITMVKSLTRTESALSVVFYMNVIQFLLGLAVLAIVAAACAPEDDTTEPADSGATTEPAPVDAASCAADTNAPQSTTLRRAARRSPRGRVPPNG